MANSVGASMLRGARAIAIAGGLALISMGSAGAQADPNYAELARTRVLKCLHPR